MGLVPFVENIGLDDSKRLPQANDGEMLSPAKISQIELALLLSATDIRQV
jgi:hypothetical protein